MDVSTPLAFLTDIWDKHSRGQSFSHERNILSCVKHYRNLQGFQRHENINGREYNT